MRISSTDFFYAMKYLRGQQHSGSREDLCVDSILFSRGSEKKWLPATPNLWKSNESEFNTPNICHLNNDQMCPQIKTRNERVYVSINKSSSLLFFHTLFIRITYKILKL